MTAVPVAVSSVVLAAELDNASEWIERHGWTAEIVDAERITLDLHLTHPADSRPLLLRGTFDGYRGIPPLWTFLDPTSKAMVHNFWPAAGPVGNQASIFHSFGIICAHFSRTGYSELGGPHAWGGLSKWSDVREGVHAESLGEMLSVFLTHLRHSPGRLG